MNCTEVCLLLSAAEDGEVISSGALALAQAHCAECPDCAAFSAFLTRMREAPAPKAPVSVVNTITALIPENIMGTHASVPAPAAEPQRARASELGAQAPGAPPASVSTTATKRHDAKTHHSLPRLAIILSSAAVLLITAGVGLALLMQEHGAQDQELSEATSLDATTSDQAAGSGETSVSSGAAAPETAIATAPDYISFGGTVYLYSGETAPKASELTTAGVISSSLDTSGTVLIHTAYCSQSDMAALYIPSDVRGEYLIFTRVTRSVGQSDYALVTDVALTHFGEWPTLPARFEKPVTSDGAPSFRLFGFDDLGVNVYVATGLDVTEGVAVAPGTAPDDPAAGNPNWTWWQRVE